PDAPAVARRPSPPTYQLPLYEVIGRPINQGEVNCRASAFCRRRPLFDHLVDQPERLGIRGRKEAIALERLLDRLHRLAGVLDVDLVESTPQTDDLARVDLDVARLALEPAGGLVDHDSGVRQRKALALSTGGQQQRAHRGGLATANRGHVAADVAHCVVDRETRRDYPARRVDIERDVLLRVLRLEEQ